ncbi:ATP-binding protein [Rhodoferax sp.]|uniref:ATP-binding protein n=1 Tax=Rhodoferax sp. TaxID=50421 RepID=UPI002634F689|nr:ATP-binding protein [Rhodoferax sp.]MDD2918548.1 ATP-binding protein [Rhodoferax sp.]
MKRALARRHGLTRLYTLWLAALFIAIELVTVVSALVFVFLPISQRAADDLAGLMVLSAQTWVELPPETRPVFEDELLHSYQMALRPDMASAPDTSLRHGWYLYFLERAFERRLGKEVFFQTELTQDGSEWLWLAVPTGGRSMGVGFARSRMQANPFGALTVALLVGTLLVPLLAWWLASRIAKPVARLELAAAHLARGASPALLPETGPRELADLARHFNHMALQVRELSDARTTLFAGISHDLRTPLTRMRLALELLSLKPDARLLQRLEHDIDEMNQLIGQLLDIARGLKIEAAQVLDLGGWLRARAEVQQAAADAAHAKLVVQCPGALQVLAPPGMLARVIDNLLGNALRYAPGPIELVGQALPSPLLAEPAGVRIGVLDRGPGIPPDQLDAVLRPFHRLEESRSQATGGFGLGLAIVQQLAHANGWVFRLEGREGGGLAAWLELPSATSRLI